MRTWWIFVTAWSVEQTREGQLRDEYVAEAQRAAHERASKSSRVEELRQGCSEVYTRKTPEYRELLRGAGVWEQQIGYFGPVLVARPHTEEEVRAALKWAEKYEFTVGVKSAGTQPGAWYLQSDMLIHMGAFSHVTVLAEESEERLLKVGGGALWMDVYGNADSRHLNVNGGAIADSVAGSVLSGGASWWGYRHGLIADSVVSARIVLPNGDVAVAGTHYDPEMKDNAVSEADILWTLRGGFPTGVVTELTLRAYPAGKPFLMGKLQCMSPAGSETKSREMLEGLLEPIATSDATVQLKVSGGNLFLHFVADEPDALLPVLASPVLSTCAVTDLRGHRFDGLPQAAIMNAGFRRKRISDMPRYVHREFGSPAAFHGESQGALVGADAAKTVAHVVDGTQIVNSPGAVEIEVWPLRPAAQDAVGHAFPHSEPLLVVVRCQVLGVCPQLWLWLSPATHGLYAGAMSSVLPGDTARIYGDTYRASHCMVQTLSPARGPRMLLGDAPANRPEDASAVARQAQTMLACSAPFLAFDACAPEHAGTVLVTGGSSGLGMVAARMLAQQGLKVIIASRSEVNCARAAQEVYLETGYSPYCISTDLEHREQIDRLVQQVQRLVPDGLDAAIFAAARLPDGTGVEAPEQLDAAVKVVLGNLYLASQLLEHAAMSPGGRAVFVTSRTAFRRASPEVLSVLSERRTFSDTYVSAQALAAFGAQGLRMAYPTLSVGLAIASPVRTKLVTMALKSGQLDAELHAELGSAPHGPEALLASGSSLLRALEPGFCADGCGELQCSMPADGVCSAWAQAQRFLPFPSIETCPFSFHASFMVKAVQEGVAGSVAAAINVLATLPAYNVLDVNVQTGQGLLASTEAIGSHESGIARFYSGLSTAILLGPVLRFGDTFAHGTAVAVFGSNSVVAIWLSTILICIVYPMWRLLIYLIAFPERVGLARAKSASGEPAQSKTVGAILSSTVLACFPFWICLDGLLLVLPDWGPIAWAIGGAAAGLASCVCTVSGSGLCMRLPLCGFEGALFVVAYKALNHYAEYGDFVS